MNHSTENSSTAEKCTRSAKAPTISAQVIAAKVAWKATNDSSGMTTPLLKVAATESGPMPLRKIFDRSPKKRPSAPKASE